MAKKQPADATESSSGLMDPINRYHIVDMCRGLENGPNFSSDRTQSGMSE